MKPSFTIPDKSQIIGSPCEPGFHGHFRPLSNQYMINTKNTKFHTNISRGAATGCSILFQNFILIRSQDLGPIKRPLTGSIDSNIRKVLKMGIKLKWGETPTSRSLRKLPKSGTHAKPFPRRAVLLLVPKTADGRIARYFKEKFLSLRKISQKRLLDLTGLQITFFFLLF